ncbi:MAG: NAD(P)/FAD-dependent oxidoreductase [Mesorhizobium sp.]|nr:MAG: NAD(P)/FAD-dependent oxidoreductase [Mesorhizobium sp.]RWL34205.1 MAG: NAD(P)/FAD-dependent oxidoreductase [Mesorhizobium sp.]RWL35621.1 MAG: NAD(P)/FAD-dependent oxidoreductase [Mesorhizobium sp.]RWL41031.1 MAG: NAD(P)/FAD-dependent oxidoreductase [Mesorhizobium sp.]RWL52203.1 MAG: NAD(P)/FAD-dependent oxidoreductase [Mesorhizobium sp.]
MNKFESAFAASVYVSPAFKGAVDAPSTVAIRWLQQFDKALEEGDSSAAANLFAEDSYWRDLVTFTWTIKTMEGRDQVAAMLESVLGGVKPSSWQLIESATEEGGIISAWIEFETATARGLSLLRLRNGLCWTFLTAIKELKGHEEWIGRRRPRGAPVGISAGPNWSARRDQELAEIGIETDPYVLIVGGGQGGLALAARLKQLDVPTLIVDKFARSGDQWRSRYESLCLHDPVWYDHLPYMPFPENWPVYTPKDKIAEWLEIYEKVMELDCWHSTTCTHASYDQQAGRWTVEVSRNGEERKVFCKHLVLATGASGFPNLPAIEGMDRFQGQLWHSSQHPGGDAWRGQKVVVIGANNSAHDICSDLAVNGADVTMVQRSSTLVARSSTLMEFALKPLYSEDALDAGITTERADLIVASLPYRLFAELQKPLYAKIREHDAEFYERLRAAGFMLDFGEDGSGLMLKYLRRGGGYYIDVGASDMIADGRIKLKSNVSVREMTENAVILSDGTELPADLVVCATGYSSMGDWAAQLISKEVADKIGPCWGLGSDTTNDPGPWEGELRNMWKPTAQEGLWFHGGNLHYSRHYSLYLALQLKARMEKIPTPVYSA